MSTSAAAASISHSRFHRSMQIASSLDLTLPRLERLDERAQMLRSA